MGSDFDNIDANSCSARTVDDLIVTAVSEESTALTQLRGTVAMPEDCCAATSTSYWATQGTEQCTLSVANGDRVQDPLRIEAFV